MSTKISATDSSTPVNTTIDSAALDISAGSVGASIPVPTSGFVPGDTLTRGYLAYRPTLSVITLTSYGWTAETPRTAVLTC